ncbi:MAG: type I methionyl aminopeptidase [Planctomycetota bacterium]|jgi:methionyl aminopeptidase
MPPAPILKTAEEIEIMKEAGKAVSDALSLLSSNIKPGISTLELDQLAENLLISRGGIPAFKGYPSTSPEVKDFPGTICSSINEEVVHGIPSAEKKLKDGDIISIDVGVEINGFFGDAARTYAVGNPNRRVKKLLDAGMGALKAAIDSIRPDVPLTRISKSIQDFVESRKFSVVRQFVGHGIGKRMHEPPQVPNFLSSCFASEKVILKPGTVIAIEPMVNAGKSEVEVMDDGWTVVTKDRKLSVHFEDTVAIGPDGPIVLTN